MEEECPCSKHRQTKVFEHQQDFAYGCSSHEYTEAEKDIPSWVPSIEHHGLRPPGVWLFVAALAVLLHNYHCSSLGHGHSWIAFFALEAEHGKQPKEICEEHYNFGFLITRGTRINPEIYIAHNLAF